MSTAGVSLLGAVLAMNFPLGAVIKLRWSGDACGKRLPYVLTTTDMKLFLLKIRNCLIVDYTEYYYYVVFVFVSSYLLLLYIVIPLSAILLCSTSNSLLFIVLHHH